MRLAAFGVLMKTALWAAQAAHALPGQGQQLSMKYSEYKADCIAYLRFLLSQEPSNCDWRLGYLLAMSKKKLLPTASAPVATAFLLFELFFIKVE